MSAIEGSPVDDRTVKLLRQLFHLCLWRKLLFLEIDSHPNN